MFKKYRSVPRKSTFCLEKINRTQISDGTIRALPIHSPSRRVCCTADPLYILRSFSIGGPFISRPAGTHSPLCVFAALRENSFLFLSPALSPPAVSPSNPWSILLHSRASAVLLFFFGCGFAALGPPWFSPSVVHSPLRVSALPVHLPQQGTATTGRKLLPESDPFPRQSSRQSSRQRHPDGQREAPSILHREPPHESNLKRRLS